ARLRRQSGNHRCIRTTFSQLPPLTHSGAEPKSSSPKRRQSRAVISRNTMKIRLLNIFFLYFTLFLGCESKNGEEELAKKTIGNWNVERDVYTKGSLVLNTNKTFQFSEEGHLSETHSNGTWNIKNDTLILNSLMPTECLYVNNFSPYCEDKYIVTKEKIETTIENCEPKKIGKFYTKFSNEKFVIKKDTLIYVNENKNCANEQFPYKIFK
ncbi:MAG: hypothetical protein K0M63_00025, partial [Weeksellaceae bacterium]|nr:hypothetical protein [Weeksellaceae bacterium]